MSPWAFQAAPSASRSAALRAPRGSVRSAATDQVRRGRDHPLAMLEQPLGVAVEEVELMLAAFLTHRPDVPYGMRARHLRDELREQMRFGPRSLQHLVAEEHQFLEHHLLRA